MILEIGEHVLDNHKFFVGRGFGYQRDPIGIPRHREHKFNVQLGQFVEIGNGTNIDVGRDRHTEIGDYTKIDSLVHIGHSAIIGRKCIIVSGTVIGGHAEIGDGCHLGMNCSIRQGIKIGRGSFVGMGAVVTKDVPEHCVVYGNPARIIGRNDIKPKRLEYIDRSIWYE